MLATYILYCINKLKAAHTNNSVLPRNSRSSCCVILQLGSFKSTVLAVCFFCPSPKPEQEIRVFQWPKSRFCYTRRGFDLEDVY
jgi:hypothetical protein